MDSGRHSKMDQICRSPRDREIWMAAEAAAIVRFQNKIRKLLDDVLCIKIALEESNDNLGNRTDTAAYSALESPVRRLLEFVRSHSGPSSSESKPGKDELGR